MTNTAARHCGTWDQDICSTVALLESSHAAFYPILRSLKYNEKWTACMSHQLLFLNPPLNRSILCLEFSQVKKVSQNLD